MANLDERQAIARQLESIVGRFEELSIRITLPEVIADSALLTQLMRDHADMAEQAEFAKEYIRLSDELEEARLMLEDADMRDMAAEEISVLAPKLDDMTRQARLILLPKDPDDHRNAILEVRAGAGGDEAGLFAAELLRMYVHYADGRGWQTELIEDGSTELGGVKESTIMIRGRNVFQRLKYESGVHRVQRVPVTESSGRIHTSTATVAVLPEAENVEISIDPADLKIDTYRASGAGGQHVNRTDSAERSQLQNRERAMTVLASRLYDMERQKKINEYSDRRKNQVGTGDRSERIRTYNFPQGRVTDHRIGLTLYRLNDVLNGDLDEIIDALALAEQTETEDEA